MALERMNDRFQVRIAATITKVGTLVGGQAYGCLPEPLDLEQLRVPA